MTTKGKVLVIDDEKNITFVMKAILEKAGFEVTALNQSPQAVAEIEEEGFDAVVTDLYMPGMGGMEVLGLCRTKFPDLPVVVITAHGTVEAAVAALKKGAFDFITKPFDQEELVNVVRKAVETGRRREEEPSSPSVSRIFSSIIGDSPEMQDVFRMIAKIADSPTTVLIRGESGTGKELVAFEIHRNSSRVSKPFIRINCAAIPATLIESELFGYERGAFTGAVTSKPGRFELAHEGTLFLDEVADMPLEMQVKLLRVLQEQEFERVGGVTNIRVDVRIVTATNKDLDLEVKAGRFREDLYYRLNVVPINLPPLRSRRDDIPALVQYFLVQFNQKLKKNVREVHPVVMEAFRLYTWPGNIRQLENVLERMVLMSEGDILQAPDLPSDIALAAGLGAGVSPGGGGNVVIAAQEIHDGASLKDVVKKQTQTLERELIEKILEETLGNVTRAAERLGLSRKGLQLKLKELGIKKPLVD